MIWQRASVTRLGRLALLAFGLAGCANPAKTGPETGASVAPSAPPPSPPAPSAPPAASAFVAPKIDSAPRTSVEGCLAVPPSDAHPPTRSFFRPRPDKVEVAVEAGAARVAHHLTHACCLHAETRLEHSGQSVTLVEELSGEPCRCRCSSVIHSRVPLAPGEHELRVRLDQAGDKRDVHQQTITIP